jgi:hypothetical protein
VRGFLDEIADFSPCELQLEALAVAVYLHLHEFRATAWRKPQAVEAQRVFLIILPVSLYFPPA